MKTYLYDSYNLPYTQNLFYVCYYKLRDRVVIPRIKPFRKVPIINLKDTIETNSNFNK